MDCTFSAYPDGHGNDGVPLLHACMQLSCLYGWPHNPTNYMFVPFYGKESEVDCETREWTATRKLHAFVCISE